MLSVDEAIEAVLSRCRAGQAFPNSLTTGLGHVLAEDIAADIDVPPFDKALMDGYAVRSADLSISGERRFRVTEEITAGRVPTLPIREGEAARIMTGAPLPAGADAVVMVERSRMDGPEVILEGPVRPGQNRMTRGREMRAGDNLLTRGTVLDASKLGLIASAGRGEVSTVCNPFIGIISTGDELVRVFEVPGPGQIRDSNGVILGALMNESRLGNVKLSRPVGDDPAALREAFATELGMPGGSRRGGSGVDVLLVSGGVSAGTRDLVPGVLVDLGIEPVFHKVNVKPGKPLWFGVGPDRGDQPGALVFGLPGNPVSVIVCFLLFVRPALEALAGRGTKRTQLASFPLGAPFEHRGDRPTYHPSRLVEGRLIPLDWAGSSDLRTVAMADGFAAFPAGDEVHQAGDRIPFLPLRREIAAIGEKGG